MQGFLAGFCGGGLMLAVPWPGAETLPGRVALLAGCAGAGWILLLPRFRRRSPGRAWPLVGLGLLAGLFWSATAHHQALVARHGEGVAGRAGDPAPRDAVAVTARVESDPLPLRVAPGQPPALRFQARVSSSASGVSEGASLRLSWYGAESVRRGDVWRFRAVLRGPWGYANPGGFDYERWLLGAGIDATGYVRSGTLLARPPPAPIQRARDALTAMLAESGLPRRGILQALLTGWSGGIDGSHWETFRATGTVHLMVISGLHVSLAAALGLLLARWASRVCPLLPLWLDARSAGALGGAAVASAYVALAGAGVPALRALLMSVSVLAWSSWGRTGRVESGLLLALAAVLVFDPLAVHQQGFWLSFGAVFVLLMVLGGRCGRQSRVAALFRAQAALSLGLLPLLALGTGSLPWTGIPANLLAVPAMSLVVVPLTLLGGALAALSTAAAELVFRLADLTLAGVMAWLGWLARAPALHPAAPPLALLAAQLCALWWLLEPPRWHLPVLALCFALMLAHRSPRLQMGEYRVAALDVGQGTAVLVDTRGHRLLFDAGPAFPSGFETGSAVVVPSLLATGAPRLDTVILSHEDLDHVGGARYVSSVVEVGQVLSSGVRPDAGLRPETASCHGRRWRWDGVTFRVLRLPRPADASDNDRSCVLLVDDGRHRMLLAGDLSSRVEPALLRRLREAGGSLGVTLLFAPHHGSATSSSAALVRLLRPALVFVSAGRNNRFGHPHPQVVERYRRVGARLYQTGLEGALIWQSSEPERVVRWRADRAPYWRARAESNRQIMSRSAATRSSFSSLVRKLPISRSVSRQRTDTRVRYQGCSAARTQNRVK